MRRNQDRLQGIDRDITVGAIAGTAVEAANAKGPTSRQSI
jgi:hypothetical protein